MKHIYFIFILLTATANATTKQQQDYINSLSDNQLYGAYTSQLIQQMENELGQQANNPKIKQLINNCISSTVRAVFTPDDLKTMFIQPPNMNPAYFDAKIDQFIRNNETCIRNGR